MITERSGNQGKKGKKSDIEKEEKKSRLAAARSWKEGK